MVNADGSSKKGSTSGFCGQGSSTNEIVTHSASIMEQVADSGWLKVSESCVLQDWPKFVNG